MNAKNIQNYRLSLLIFAASLGAVSCTSETELGNAQDEGNIVFSAQVDKPMSRVTESAWDGDELIGIKSGETVKIYKVATDGTMTTNDTPFRWEGAAYSIQAWTPMTTEQINLTDQTTQKKLFDCDLLASETTVESKSVHLAFHHRMTRMWWELQVHDGYTDEEANNATISFLGYGAVTYTNGEVTPIGKADQTISTHNSWGEWYRNGEAMMVPCEMWEKPLIRIEIGGDTYTYTPSKANQNDVAKKTGDLLPNTWQRYYLSVRKTGLTVDMKSSSVGWDNTETIDGITDASLKSEIPSDVTSLPDYTVEGITNGYITDKEAGFTITYTENDLGGLTWNGTCDVERTEELVSSTFRNAGVPATKQTYKFSNIQSDITIAYQSTVEAGDYFYNDGTWGKEETKEGRTTLGRVFRVGQSDADESIYPMPKVRGYVVCTTYNDATERAWVTPANDPEYLTALNDIPINADVTIRENCYSGYSLTTSINNALSGLEASWQEKAPFWYAFKNTGVEAPANTSGWYIPAIGQLKSIWESTYYNVSGMYWSSQIYAGTANTGDVHGIEDGEKTTIWCLSYNGTDVGYNWSPDPRKLIIVLTF